MMDNRKKNDMKFVNQVWLCCFNEVIPTLKEKHDFLILPHWIINLPSGLMLYSFDHLWQHQLLKAS